MKCLPNTFKLDPENMGKDTKINFLSQILRTLWGIEYLAHLPQMVWFGLICVV